MAFSFDEEMEDFTSGCSSSTNTIFYKVPNLLVYFQCPFIIGLLVLVTLSRQLPRVRFSAFPKIRLLYVKYNDGSNLICIEKWGILVLNKTVSYKIQASTNKKEWPEGKEAIKIGLWW